MPDLLVADVLLWLRSPGGAPLACLAPVWSATAGYRFNELRYRRAQNEVTELELRMPLDAAPPGTFFALDARLEVWIDGRLDTETQWFVRVPPTIETGEAGQQQMVVRASCALYLLQGRIVAYPDGSPQTDKTGPADDLIKEYVGENMLAGALPDRDLSAYVALDDPLGLAATVQKVATRRNLHLVCQELARASAQAGVPLFFDAVWNGQQLVVRTWVNMRGLDRTTGALRVVLAPEWGTLADAALLTDHRDERTVIYTNDTGNLVAVSDDDRRNASPFNRREQYMSSPNGSNGGEADGALFRGRPRTTLRGALRSTVQLQYGQQWQWGDRVVAALDGDVAPFAVHAVAVVVADGGLTAMAELRSGSLDDADAVRRIEAVLDAGNAGSTPGTGGGGGAGTATPTADSLVRSPMGSSTIDDGWLSAGIVRTGDARLSNARPPLAHQHTISDLPVAVSGSTSSTQVVRADDLRLGDARVPLSHTHAASDITAGTLALARLPVALSGVQSTTQLVRADDSRLSNARLPTAHTHDAGELTTGLLPVARGGTGVGAIPAFSVHKNGVNQACAGGAFTKLTWGGKAFDSTNNFAADRFTPTVAGKYLFIASVLCSPGQPDQTSLYLSIYKNGVRSKDVALITSGTAEQQVQLSVVLDANGATDFFELYLYTSNAPGAAVFGGSSQTHWSGVRVAA